MIGKDSVTCMGSLFFLFAFSLYSYNGFEQVMTNKPLDGLDKNARAYSLDDVLKNVTVGSLQEEVALSAFNDVVGRNPFQRRKKPVKKLKKPIVVKMPKVKIKPKEIAKQAPVPVEVEERYFYRGTVYLKEKTTYVIERESDRKTFFVNKGDKTKDFIVLETTAKQVVITDYDENIKILKKIK